MAAPMPDRDELAAANINPDTGLATDYLNHFNEVAMLIDMLASMPDVVEDIMEWRPITYPEHFHVTGFRAKDLAIEAYGACDPAVLAGFHDACEKVENGVANIQGVLEKGVEALSDPSAAAAELYTLISAVGGVINPHGFGDFDMSSVGAETGSSAEDQSAIDALFD